MRLWVALLRGINVGGNNKLPMADLKSELQSQGYSHVQTYIQSGNLVFHSDENDAGAIARSIADLIEQRHEFRPHVLVLGEHEFLSTIKNNPYPVTESAGKTLHFFFLSESVSDPDIVAMEAIRAESEEFELCGCVFYLLAPDGIGRSKLAARAEKLLGVVTTARNFRTVQKLQTMLEQ